MADTPKTVFVRGTGGGILEMDVPTYGHALERWEQALAKGDLSIVEEAHWVERGDGSKYLVAGEAPKPARAKATNKASKATDAVDAPVVDDPAES